MNEQTQQAIRDHAQQVFPKECCGLIAVVNGKERYFACNNIAETDQEHFVIDPEEYAYVEDLGEVIAVVHSHPNYPALPSDADKVLAERTELTQHIVHVDESGVAGYIHTFYPTGYTAPLVGRHFVFGVLDCYTLIQDWYRTERGIELPHFDRRDKFWERGENLYLDNFEACGFKRVRGPLERGDVILMQIRSAPMIANHGGVYVGDGLMLHHLAGRLSSRDLYDGYFQENTMMAIRYEGDA